MAQSRSCTVIGPIFVQGCKVIETEYDDNPNCFVVNCDRTRRMSCHVPHITVLWSKCRRWFGEGRVGDRVVLEQSGFLVFNQETFLELEVSQHFMHLKAGQKWTPNDGKIPLESIPLEQFYLRPVKEVVRAPRPVCKRVLDWYRVMAKDNLYKKKEAWRKYNNKKDLEDIVFADPGTLLKEITGEGSDVVTMLIAMKARDFLNAIYDKEGKQDFRYWMDPRRGGKQTLAPIDNWMRDPEELAAERFRAADESDWVMKPDKFNIRLEEDSSDGDSSDDDSSEDEEDDDEENEDHSTHSTREVLSD